MMSGSPSLDVPDVDEPKGRRMSATNIAQKLRENRHLVGADIEMEMLNGTWRSNLDGTTNRDPQREARTRDPDQEVGIRHLISFLLVEVEKRMHLRQLIPYSAFVVVLTMVAFLTRLPTGDYSDSLQQTEEVSVLLKTDRLYEVHDPDEYWAWLDSVMVGIWADSGSRSCAGLFDDPDDARACNPAAAGYKTVPVGIAMLRQWRVSGSPCGTLTGSLSNAIAPCDRGLLPCNCTHKYSEHTTSREPFGPEGEYVTDEEAGRPLHPLPVYTEHLTYDVMSAQFSLFLALTETKDTVLSNLTEAKNADWIDEASRVVSLDMLFYNADSESFARASCFIEYFQTGRGIPGCFFYAPFVLELFGQDVWLTILNLVLFMYTLPMLYWLVQSVHFRLFRKKSYHIWGDLFQAAHLGMLIAICTLRAKMWNLASVMTSGYFYSEFVTPAFGGFGVGSAEGHLMFHYFSQYTWYMRTYDQVLALGVIMTWFRVFRYIQHFQQLNVLSETAKNAALDVLRLTVTFIWSVASFSIAGCVLFGANLREFETPTHAGSTLIRMLFVEHEPDYDGMRDIQPVWAPVFLAMYFILCYFMLLNMVLAVIVSSFTTVQAAQENARKQMQARQDGLLDEEIAQLRTQSTSVAVATASQSTRFLRLARFVKQTVNAAKASVAIIVDTNHAEREEAIHIAKAHCAKDLRIPREVLSERPEFYRRISISKGEMKRVFRSLLSDDDLERLFMGVQKEEMEDQDKTAILAAAFSEQTRDLKAHFEHVETRFDRLHDVIKMMAARREAADRDLASLRAQVDRLRRDDDQRSGSVHSAGNRAKREAADGGDHFRRHVRDLESERDFLITRLASSEQRSRDGDTAFLYQQPALSMSPYTPLQPN